MIAYNAPVRLLAATKLMFHAAMLHTSALESKKRAANRQLISDVKITKTREKKRTKGGPTVDSKDRGHYERMKSEKSVDDGENGREKGPVDGGWMARRSQIEGKGEASSL